eukprot:967648-Rhodomonas_salina.2
MVCGKPGPKYTFCDDSTSGCGIMVWWRGAPITGYGAIGAAECAVSVAGCGGVRGCSSTTWPVGSNCGSCLGSSGAAAPWRLRL